MKKIKLSRLIGYLLVSPVLLYIIFILLLLICGGTGIIEIKKFRVLIGAYLMNNNNTLLNLGLFAISGSYLLKD
jgi:hypothetical protein